MSIATSVDTKLIAEVGGDIIGLITSGMYDTPLAAVREYVQNSADAYASIGITDGRVDIEPNPANLSLIVRDYGPGLTPDEAIEALLPVARSNKKAEQCRGFRGIGRLSGLAFARSLRFLTRAAGEQHAISMTWDGARLREQIMQGESASSAIERSVDIRLTEAPDHPGNFFEVQVNNVARHAAPYLLNSNRLRAYISEVCPVPFAGSFGFGGEIERYIAQWEPLCGLQIHFGIEETHVTRPFTDVFSVSGSQEDACKSIEFVDIPSVDGRGSAAVGWIAHSSYLGAIHKTDRVRGIRARVGNLQVGSEAGLDALFEEERFNRWCIGEFHVLDRRIVPNARRDYFEPNPHLQNLESKLSIQFKQLSAHCRRASLERNKKRRLTAELSELSRSRELATSIHLSKELAMEICEKVLDRIDKLKPALSSSHEEGKEVAQLEQSILALMQDLKACDDGERGHAGLPYLQTVFRTLTKQLTSNAQAEEIIEAIMRDLHLRK